MTQGFPFSVDGNGDPIALDLRAPAGAFNLVWNPIGAAALFALPCTPDGGLAQGPPPFDARHSFIVAQACVLDAVHIKADATNLGSVNTLAPPIPVNVDLYINGAFVQTLATIPPNGLTTFDVNATGLNIPIGPTDLVWFVVDLTAWTAGQLGNLLINIALA